jgi:lactate racemase
MKVKLAYGRNGLEVELPGETKVFTPRFVPGLEDEAAALRAALENPIESLPLGEKVKAGQRVVIVHTDITRATPNERILPVLLQVLEQAGVRREDIRLLNGLGTHRPQTEQELRRMLGDKVVEQYCCLQHDCHNEAGLVALGTTSRGNPVRANRDYMEADFKILTGFIEPHFFAGFSGGPKAVLPSLAGAESVFTNHGYEMIAHPNAAWGVTEGNPIWEEMREAALMTRPDFLLNVTLNAHHEITGVFAGDMLAAHRQGCQFVRETAMAPFSEPYDIAITTNSGYPLDQNLYQTVKGMSAAARVVRRGGAIILAAACQDGLPDHGRYGELLRSRPTPQELLEMMGRPGFEVQDQWQVQIQAQIQLHADVHVYSQGLSDEQIRGAQLIPCRNIEAALEMLMAEKGSRVCVLPEGPQVVPYRVDPAGS